MSDAEGDDVLTGPVGSMDVNSALKDVLKNALIHDGLASLRECAKALGKRQPHLCILANNCDEQMYVMLVQALCNEHGINLLKEFKVQILHSSTKSSSQIRCMDKRSRPEEFRTSEKDPKRPRFSQLPLSPLPNNGDRPPRTSSLQRDCEGTAVSNPTTAVPSLHVPVSVKSRYRGRGCM